jgi:GH35 family endo-1,4-beta-xylanase
VVWEGTNGTITTGTDPGAAIAELGIAWFRNHGIFNIRGHNVIWPDWSQLPGDVNILTGTGTIAGKQTQVEDRITTVGEGSYPGHMSNEAGNTHIKSFLRDWDAVNEPFVKFTVLNYFIGQSATEGSIRSASQYLEDSGSDAVTIENWLIPLVATDPLPYLFINENGLETNYLHCPNDNITMDTYNPPINQEECYLYNLLLTLSSTATESVPIDGFGFESHFETDNGSDLNQAIIDTPLTPPVTLQQVFGEFAGLNILAEATEYDQGLYYYSYAVANENPIDNNAPNWMTPMQYMSAQAIQADYLTDYLTVVYSTPNFDSFTSWGFWDGDGEDWPNCNAPIYNKDWSLKPSGLAWVNLVKNAWWTSATSGTSNGSGVAPVSGFLGRYSLKGSYGGYTKTYHVTLTASAAGGTTTPVQMEFNGTSGSKNVWLYNAVDSALENRAFGTQDPTAYGGFYVTGPGYIYFPSPTSYPTPDMRIDLDPSDALPTGDTVYVWFRCKVPDSNTGDNKFYYDMNNGNYTETPVLSGTNTWQWNKVEQVTLTSGTSYSVGVVWSGSNLQIDQVLTTDDSAFTP